MSKLATAILAVPAMARGPNSMHTDQLLVSWLLDNNFPRLSLQANMDLKLDSQLKSIRGRMRHDATFLVYSVTTIVPWQTTRWRSGWRSIIQTAVR